MPKKATIIVHPGYEIGEISPRLYSAFLEPIGNMVNGSMYNPKHPTADEKGLRHDFIDAIAKTDLPAVRLPGGNFVSGWDWKDSIGPRESRKVHLDLAWRQYITNDVGHDEYLQWAEMAKVEPLYTINLGTGDINDATSIVEYTNHKGGTYWSDLRRKNGHEDPYGVKLWYLGNEPDGYWQIGSWMNNPKGYGILANESSKLMKWVDPRIETVACVSCSPNLAHYPEWDLTVLQECYHSVDYISMHHYQSVVEGDLPTFLGASRYFEDYINTEIAICDYVAAKLKSPRKMMLSFDEYGTMMRPKGELHYGRGEYPHFLAHYYTDPDRQHVMHDPDNMPTRGPRMGGDMLGALANASTLLAFLRHADRVKIGCATGGLGILASCDREHVWATASAYPYTQLMRYGRGTSLRTSVDCDTYDIPSYIVDDTNQYYEQEGVDFIDTAAAYDKESGEVNIFVINRNWESSNDVELDLRGFDGLKFIEHIEMHTDDLTKANTWQTPDAIKPVVNPDAKFEGGKLSACVKPLSWNVFRFQK
ncbi:MAG: alpha-L-arabinofuranosidase [Oscillospiraceae bacterium]|nr:alpha-L-arabinofuranosidase [Oscillospiraceae bacterium]